jgi:hypothetical protein
VDFEGLLKAFQKPDVIARLPLSITALDPGETTGACAMGRDAMTLDSIPNLKHAGHLDTDDMDKAVKALTEYFDVFTPQVVVIEDYRIYAWKADDHKWSGLHTPRVIGCIETLCIQRGIVYVKQTAQVAKGFCTDKKLQEWGWYFPSIRHGRDAIRHAVFYLLFNHFKPGHSPHFPGVKEEL